MAFPDWASPAKLSRHCWCAPFVLPCSSWPCCHVPVILYSLSSPHCSVWGVLPQLCFQAPSALSLPSCSRCLVLAIMYWVSCHICPVSDVLSMTLCPGFLALAGMSWKSCLQTWWQELVTNLYLPVLGPPTQLGLHLSSVFPKFCKL